MPDTSNKTRFFDRHPKRASQRLPAVATVEAACIFPFIFFFFISVVWIMDLFFIHSKIGAIVDTVGNEIVAYSYPYSLAFDTKGIDDESSYNLSGAIKAGWSEASIRSKISRLPEADKISALSLLFSDFKTDGGIDIVATYYIKPYLYIPGIKGIYLTNHFYSKAYTGYSGKDASSEETVYITEHGTVYHTSLNCQALKVSPSEVEFLGISKKRNESGAKYYPCKDCSYGEHGDTVFITPYGSRYHYSKNCSHLRVEVFEVPTSQAAGRPLCKFCQKKGKTE